MCLAETFFQATALKKIGEKRRERKKKLNETPNVDGVSGTVWLIKSPAEKLDSLQR